METASTAVAPGEEKHESQQTKYSAQSVSLFPTPISNDPGPLVIGGPGTGVISSYGILQIPQARRVSSELGPESINCIREMVSSHALPPHKKEPQINPASPFPTFPRAPASDVILSLDPNQLSFQEAHNVC